MRLPLLTALALVALVGCGGPSFTSERGPHRLSEDIRPLRYTLVLDVDPRQPRFGGHVSIDLALKDDTGSLTVHGAGLDVQASAVVAGMTRVAIITPLESERLQLNFEPPLPKGPITLDLAFTAPFSAGRGLYRVEDAGRWYAFSHFEPNAARRAFPCFDEPNFKAPFKVSVRTKGGDLAVANAPLIDTHDEAGGTRYNFVETPPLPTYLVALAVGPLEVVEAPEDAIPGVPLRVITTMGKARLTRSALERAPALHAALTRYFGRAHGFAKLDLVAAPGLPVAAMENPGLLMFGEPLLLIDPEAPAWRRRWSQQALAHELAHLWFGDLVTMSWWDDLWLKEGFAAWMGTRVAAELSPELDAELAAAAHLRWIMEADTGRDAAPVRRPVRDAAELRAAFSHARYDKGAALLRMVEGWLGAEVFRNGVLAYIEAHAGGTATTADLVTALEQASGRPVGRVLHDFLGQPGAPLIELELRCKPSAEPAPPATIRITQQRALPAGSDLSRSQRWHVPICLRYGVDGVTHRECLLLDDDDTTRTLSHPGCPDWIHPNADQLGYYQWNLPKPLLLAMAGRHREALTPRELVALAGQLGALLEARRLPVADYIEALEALAEEEHPLVLGAILDGLRRLHRLTVDPQLDAPFATYVRRLLRPHSERLGLEAPAEELDGDRLLRPQLFQVLAALGHDPDLLAQATALTATFIEDPTEVPLSTARLVLPMAARHGDEVLWQSLRDALNEAPDPVARLAVVRALGAFETPALLDRSLDLLLDNTLSPTDARAVLEGPRSAQARGAAWAWMTRHYNELAKTLRPSAAAGLPALAGNFCDDEVRDEVERFFGDPARTSPGTARGLAVVLERIDHCVRLRGHLHAPLAAALGPAATR